ncbi:MAG TPA: preprotein translocase subunit SecE [Microthrixaceae bacterium]|nr:preprotein translocase subunit SecE [Microthrixaceae bacterium]
MNREQKRAAQKAGQVNADGSPVSVRERRAPATQRLKSERTKPRQFVREVRSELKKVSWPTRDVVIRYSIIVFVALVLFTSFVFGVDFLFERLFHFIIAPADQGAAGVLSHGAALAAGSY